MDKSAVKVKEEMEAKGLFPSACYLCNGDCAHCSVARESLHLHMYKALKLTP